MKNIFGFLATHKVALALGAVLLVVVGALYAYHNRKNGEELYAVLPGPFVREVSVSGRVVAAQRVDLRFSESGRVASVPVRVGQKVSAGQVLATLAADTLASSLRSAETNLARVRDEQNKLVETSYLKLLSTDLIAVPDSAHYTAVPPVLTGLYNGPEGTYRFRVQRNTPAARYELFIFGLEELRAVEVLQSQPTPLGTRGLFISFPNALPSYDDTIWRVTIPNPSSASYATNRIAYEQAVSVRDRSVAVAEAEVERLRTEITNHTLRAPFAGTVTAVDAKVGDAVSPTTLAISLIGTDLLQIESFIPEINLPLVAVGAPAVVTLDAYGAGTPFAAAIVSIDPAETMRDGVSMYRAILQFEEQDQRIRSGMTANVVITTDRRENVLSVPQGAVILRDGQTFVRVKKNGQVVDRAIATGALSSLGTLEIVSGLSAGETVVLSPPR